METIDYQSRQRFARELDKNFSVVASAGSGKTRAITDRIVEIAQDRHALEWLAKLVVVTYTNRAADEMQQRTRQRILEAGLPLEVIEAFNRAFFGTIHSFCVKLLAAHGHCLGLPAKLELITDDEDLWDDFVQQQTTVGRSLTPENRRVLLRHIQARQLMELPRNFDADLAATPPGTQCPDTSFAKVYAAAESRARENIPRAKAELQRWEKRWRKTDAFAPWPPCATASKDFVRLWREAFRPVRDWVNACALCVAAEVQRDYREFRLARGAITYADQVALAGELMRLPEVARQVREENYRVILDEAQDTDPQQFFVLIEIARPPEAAGVFMQDRQPRINRGSRTVSESPPRAGHFCMVGDFQQSIYRDPADLAHYRALHELLIETKAADELEFSVTFRLDRAQLDFVNETFREILNNLDGQVQFVELNPRPNVLPGQVIRVDLGENVDPNLPEPRRAALEARKLAKWLSAAGLDKLRADSWREVAILCPRKAWLHSLGDALLDVDLAVETQSESDRQGENPAYAWLTALLAVIVDAKASYEIVGVLREIFGLPDDELTRFGQGYPARFQIAQQTRERGLVPDALNLLARTRRAIATQPLFSAVQEIARATQLRERLRSLPPEEFVDLIAELDALLNTAANAEADGLSLAEFANHLRVNFGKTREPRASVADAIQLITAHKAKGSEWQAVIVPFLSRKVWGAPVRYPYVIRAADAEGAQIIFDWTDLGLELDQQLKDTERQEMERLLYVALTRAKHTLVLALDAQLFSAAHGRPHKTSQITWLRANGGEPNEAALERLSRELRPCQETRLRRESELARKSGETKCERLPVLDANAIEIARARGDRFIRKLNPSAFVPEEARSGATGADKWKEIEPEFRPPRPPNAATQYGVWWHEFMQLLQWNNENSWQSVFDLRHQQAPDEKRFSREWKLFRDWFGRGEDVRPTDVQAHVELPFLWRMTDRKCLEGIIDLAFADADRRRWLIIDWKTNQIGGTRADADGLKEQYRLQIAAYWKALSAITGMPVDAALFSTATGKLLRYEEAAMKEAWRIFGGLPPGEQARQLDLF